MCRDMEQTLIGTGSGPDNNQTTPVRSLAELEDIVEKGKATFLEVAAALAEIRLRKLYKPKGWTEYLKEKFSFSRQHAHRIKQAKALADASPVGDKPRTEREARKRLGEKRLNRKQSAKPAQSSNPLQSLEPPTAETATPSLLKPPVSKPLLPSRPNSNWGAPLGEAGLAQLNGETEFERFTNQVELWQDELDDQDVDRLLRRVISYCEKVMSGEGESDEVCTTLMVSELEEVIS
jgi:hypothetical protein